MDDEIDRVSARLHAQRPALDVGSLALSERVIRVARHLATGRRKALAARALEVWEYDVLLALRASDSASGLSATQIMTATQVSSGTVTNRVDRLAERRFVSREADPIDHRGVLVRLTAAGRRRVDQASSELVAIEAAVWSNLAERRQGQLAAALRELLVAIENSG